MQRVCCMRAQGRAGPMAHAFLCACCSHVPGISGPCYPLQFLAHSESHGLLVPAEHVSSHNNRPGVQLMDVLLQLCLLRLCTSMSLHQLQSVGHLSLLIRHSSPVPILYLLDLYFMPTFMWRFLVAVWPFGGFILHALAFGFIQGPPGL